MAASSRSNKSNSILNTGTDSSLVLRPAAMGKPVARSHMSSSTSVTDQRDLLKELETLRKELDRKEARNVNLTSEMQTLRTSCATLQREVRMLSSTFEKINADRQHLSHELVKCKDYKDKLEVQLSRLGDSQFMATQAERFQSENEQLEMEMGNFRSLLAARDDRIKSLERDLEVFHRSLEIQAQYEGTIYTRGSNTVGGRETVKSLYYELGKRQTDAHSLAISLASSNQELVGLRDALREEREAKASALADCENLRHHFSQISHQSVRDKDEIAFLHEKHNNITSLSSRLQAQVEELSKRLTEERIDFEREKQENSRGLTECKEALNKSQHEVKSLRARLESLQTSLTQADSMRTITEKRLSAEWGKLSGEMEAMAEKTRRYDLLEMQLDAIKLKLSDAVAAKEEAIEAVRSLGDGEALQMQNDALSLEVDQANIRISELVRDKEQSVTALQQTMDAARELNSRLQAERQLRITLEERLSVAEERAGQAERVAEGVNKAREHVSTAVLDALHKEKLKSAALEKAIAEIRGPAPWPPLAPTSTVFGPVPAPGSRTLTEELSKLRSEIARMEEATAPLNASTSTEGPVSAQSSSLTSPE